MDTKDEHGTFIKVVKVNKNSVYLNDELMKMFKHYINDF